MLLEDRVIAPDVLARRIAELIPEYLPGIDTGAAEPTDRRICWNKTLKALLSAIAAEHQLKVELDPASHAPKDEQLDLQWRRGDAAVLVASTGWGDRDSLEKRLQRFEGLKARQKLFIYTCGRWQAAVLEQINAALLRYPFHVEGEQYLFMNLLGAESKLHFHVTEIEKNGPIEKYSPDLVRVVSGSPFAWRSR